MAKNMASVYADMLTKELVTLRAKHIEAHQNSLSSTSRKVKKQGQIAGELVAQINHELASRIADFGLKV